MLHLSAVRLVRPRHEVRLAAHKDVSAVRALVFVLNDGQQFRLSGPRDGWYVVTNNVFGHSRLLMKMCWHSDYDGLHYARLAVY